MFQVDHNFAYHSKVFPFHFLFRLFQLHIFFRELLVPPPSGFSVSFYFRFLGGGGRRRQKQTDIHHANLINETESSLLGFGAKLPPIGLYVL